MKHLQAGQFHGVTNKTIDLNGMILTDTEYTHKKVDWHYHENAYFTFIIEGNVIEGNKKEVYNCSSGSLLFHNWQEAHYNIKPDGFTRGFHIELKNEWIRDRFNDMASLEGSINISNHDTKFLFYKIFKESKLCDDLLPLSIQTLVLQMLEGLVQTNNTRYRNKPLWVSKIKEILHDQTNSSNSLESLAQTIAIHPVHLSRDFPKYFQCGVGEYIRKLRVEKSLALLAKKDMSLTKIALECGFADQSHFIRCFKTIMGSTPFLYKKLIRS